MTTNKSDKEKVKQSTVIILSGLVAIIILAGIGISYWLVKSSDEPPTVPETSIVQVPEDWPTPPPTFTSTPLPTIGPSITPTYTPTPTSTPTPTPTLTPLPPPPWGELGYLTSIEYRETTVVEIERKKFMSTERILLETTGKIQAGVDLSQIQDLDVQIKGTALKIALPQAQIISVELLPEQSKVFDSKKSWIFSQYEGIEIEALEKARKQLWEKTSNDKNMLKLAEKFAKLQLTEFLQHLGFEKVEITFKKN